MDQVKMAAGEEVEEARARSKQPGDPFAGHLLNSQVNQTLVCEVINL